MIDHFMDRDFSLADPIGDGSFTGSSIDILARTAFDPGLIAFRAKNAFVETMKFPNTSVCLKLNANAPVNVLLPSGTKAFRITSDGDYWVSRQGRASVPALSVSEETVENAGGGSMYCPNDFIFFCDDSVQLSFISETANRYISIMCWIME